MRRDSNMETLKGRTGEPSGLNFQIALLCSAISKDHLWNTGKGNSEWPTDIDFLDTHTFSN